MSTRKIIAIIQARMGSTRFPGKVMKPIGGVPMIEMLLSRLSLSKKINKIVIATSTDKRNHSLVNHVKNLGYPFFLGSENDVLARFTECASQFEADVIVRITGDCPLVDPQLVDEAIIRFERTGVDYLSNVSPPTYPDGLDVEIFSFKALEQAHQTTQNPFDREHVTPYLRSQEKFSKASMEYKEDLSTIRWTVDEPSDLIVIGNIFHYFHPRTDFSWEEVLNLQKKKPNLFLHNQHLNRNEGANLGKGQKLWKRAKQIIPGGNMLLSKRAEMFLPEQWPAYFSKAKGCKVWDLDGNMYIDMSIMGVGTNILGYGHEEIDLAVKNTIENGNMSTLNCREEVDLAEKLIELHPWANMVRLARSGGEADAIAIRIARAATGKDSVAICGYHGWHDWYLSANLGDEKNLAGHLLPGLEPNGVPISLRGTTFSFTYNNFYELKSLVNDHNIGVIIMEVIRNQEPKDNFLQKVRNLATERGIVLIFDECTSGFRQTFGGIHKLYGVDPDIAIFGKALGNGYSITAVLGKSEIMEAAQKTFISSTFWTERIGPSAALKTLEVMEREKSWEYITSMGKYIKTRWMDLAQKYNLSILTNGIPALAGFSFDSPNALPYKTLITQQMLLKGYLSGTSIYVCLDHTQEIVDQFFEQLDPVFNLIKECEEGRDINSLLKGPVCHGGFKRLN